MFSLNWSLITVPRHRLRDKKTVRLATLLGEPLILFSSADRQAGISTPSRNEGSSPTCRWRLPRRKSSCAWRRRLGVAIIVPLLPNGVVTRGKKVCAAPSLIH